MADAGADVVALWQGSVGHRTTRRQHFQRGRTGQEFSLCKKCIYCPHHKISPADIATFNTQYPKLAVRYNETFHDRFLIIDDKELYVIGASLKDLGSKCFAFTKLDADVIRRIKKSAFHPVP